MSTYIFGDIQGCYTELQWLLEKINFNPQVDRFGCVGDLVNRGPNSLEVLRFIKGLPNPIIVLGNHDLYCLAIGSGAVQYDKPHQMQAIFAAPDCIELIEWLRHQAILYYDSTQNFVMTHAGIPPQWNLQQAIQHATELSTALKSKNYKDVLQNLFGENPACWNDQLKNYDRLRYITNAFTRMRFCDARGCLELHYKGPSDAGPKNFQPWFNWPTQIPCDIIFGHWAALNGITHKENILALDTGCVWGNALTALRLEDRKIFQIEASIKKDGANRNF